MAITTTGRPSRRSIRSSVRAPAQANRNAQRAQRRQVAQMNQGARTLGRNVQFSRRAGVGSRTTSIVGGSKDLQTGSFVPGSTFLVPRSTRNVTPFQVGNIGRQFGLNNPFLTNGTLGFNPATLSASGQEGGPRFSVQGAAKKEGQGEIEKGARERLTKAGVTGKAQEQQLEQAKRSAAGVFQFSGLGATFGPGTSPAQLAEQQRQQRFQEQLAGATGATTAVTRSGKTINVEDPFLKESQKQSIAAQFAAETQAGQAEAQAQQVAQAQNRPTPPQGSFISALPEEQQGPAEEAFDPLFDYFDQAQQDAASIYGNSQRGLQDSDRIMNDYIGQRMQQDAAMFQRHDDFFQEQLGHQLDSAKRTRDSQESILNAERERSDFLFEKSIKRQMAQNERDRKDLLLDLGISGGWRASAKVADVYTALKQGEQIIADLQTEKALSGKEYANKLAGVEGQYYSNEQKAHDAYKQAALKLEDNMLTRAQEIDKTVYNHVSDRTKAITKMENDYLNTYSEIAGERARAAVDNNKWVQEQALEIAKFSYDKEKDKFDMQLDLAQLGVSQGHLGVAQGRFNLDMGKWQKEIGKVDLKLSRELGHAVNEFGDAVMVGGYPAYFPGDTGQYFEDESLNSMFFYGEDLYSRTAVNFDGWSRRIGSGNVIPGSPYHEGPDQFAVDIDGQIGDPVEPFVAGTVSQLNRDPEGPFGIFAVITDQQGNQHLYAHLNAVDENIVEGDSVQRGRPFATLGNTGNVIAGEGGDGSHLHYRITDRGGNPVEMDKFMPVSDTPLFGKSKYVDETWGAIRQAQPEWSDNRVAREVIARAELDSRGDTKFVNATKTSLVYEYGNGNQNIINESSEEKLDRLTENQQDKFINDLIQFETSLQNIQKNHGAIVPGSGRPMRLADEAANVFADEWPGFVNQEMVKDIMSRYGAGGVLPSSGSPTEALTPFEVARPKSVIGLQGRSGVKVGRPGARFGPRTQSLLSR